MNKAYFRALTGTVLVFISSAGPAWAYVGPGAGMGLISAFFALAAVVALSVVMTFLYPLRALYRKFRGQPNEEPDDASSPKSAADQENKAP